MQGQQPDESRQRERGRQQQPGAAALAQPQVRQVAADNLRQRGGDEQQQGLHLVLQSTGTRPGRTEEQLASLAPSSGAARHLLPLRRRRAGPAVAERCGKGALPPLRRRKAGPAVAERGGKEALPPLRSRKAEPAVAERGGKEALLPFTGEGARRADEGARA